MSATTYPFEMAGGVPVVTTPAEIDMTTAGQLRAVLFEWHTRGHATVGLELRAMVPVSVRTDEQHGALGNRVTTMMAPLPVWCEDPVRRMELVRQSMGDLKQSKQAMGAWKK